MLRLERSQYLGTNVHNHHAEGLTVSETTYHQKVFEGWHYHENHHISFIVKGGNRENRKQQDITACPGSILLYNEGELHRNMHTQHPSQNINLEIESSFLTRHHLDFSNLTLSPGLKLSVLKIYRESKINDACSEASMQATLLSLFSREGSKHTPPWLEQLRQLLHDRWDETLSLQQLSDLLQVHPVTISRYFPRYFSCTLGEYMRKVKIERAVDLIRQEGMSLTEIAYHCGFSDQSHFIRAFKMHTGFRPKEYQKL